MAKYADAMKLEDSVKPRNYSEPVDNLVGLYEGTLVRAADLRIQAERLRDTLIGSPPAPSGNKDGTVNDTPPTALVPYLEHLQLEIGKHLLAAEEALSDISYRIV